jgi:hypothetical protein
VRAKRDMTRREFGAALDRRGWKFVSGNWIDFQNGTGIGVIRTETRKGLRVHYRATLALAIQQERRGSGGPSRQRPGRA